MEGEMERGEKGNGIRDGTIGKELYFKIGEIFYNSLECIRIQSIADNSTPHNSTFPVIRSPCETRFFHMIFL